MISSFLVRTNYLNCYSLRLLVGKSLLILPMPGVLFLVLFLRNLDFLWITPCFVFFGLLLFLPTFSYFTPKSKERVVVESLFTAVICLAALVLSVDLTLRTNSTNSIVESLELPSTKAQGKILLKRESQDLSQKDQTVDAAKIGTEQGNTWEKSLSPEEKEIRDREIVTTAVRVWKDDYPLMSKKERQELFSLFGGGVEKWLSPEDIDYASPVFSKNVEKELSKLVQGFLLRRYGCLSEEEKKKVLDAAGDLAMRVYKRKHSL